MHKPLREVIQDLWLCTAVRWSPGECIISDTLGDSLACEHPISLSVNRKSD